MYGFPRPPGHAVTARHKVRPKIPPLRIVHETQAADACPECHGKTYPRTMSWSNRDGTHDVTMSHGCARCRLRTLAYSETPDRFAWYRVPKAQRF